MDFAQPGHIASGTMTYTSTAAFLRQQHGLRLLYRDSASGAAAQDAVLRLCAGRMESTRQSDDHGRGPLQLFQRSACASATTTFRSISALAAGTAPIPIPSFIPDTTISTRVSASRGRMATRFCALGRHLPHRWPGRRPEPSDLQYRRPLFLQQHVVPRLSYPLTPFLQYAEAGGLGVVSPRDLDRNRKDDYVAAWTASIQRKLPLNILGTASYLGNKGTDVLTTTYTNLVNPATGVAPYPAFGPVSWRGDVGNSTFHALQSTPAEPFRTASCFSANYMWSHSINDGSIGGGESDTPQDSFCRACDKASATMTFARYSISPPFTSCHSERESISRAAPALRGRYWAAGR
jgi:hypothetical protein